MRDPSEKPIVDGLRRGERAAFDAAYGRFRARVYAFLLRLSGRRDVAEDLLQETWVRLARASPALAEDTDLAAWLFTVARNQYVSWRRWSALDLSRFVALGDDATSPATTAPPDEATDAARAMHRLEIAMARLAPAHREVLLLIGVEGFDQEQAAGILGVRYDALRQRLARARAQLAAALEKMDVVRPQPLGAR